MSDATYKIALSRMELTEKIPHGSPMWTFFNASFDNLELTAPDLACAIFAGKAQTTHHRDRWRTGANYLCGQSLGLDFDTEDERSTLKALTADKFLARHAAILHTTMSHTPDKPRARAVFVLDTPIMQACNYALAATALLWLFGTADRQCKDAARFWYGSPDCDMELPEHVLPLATLRKVIEQYQATGQRERKAAAHRDYAAPADQREVADALKAIPAWGIGYDDWLAVLMGLHAEFGDGGRDLADSWADGRPGEVEQKWKSFKPSGNTAGAIGIGTVFALAKRNGWRRSA
jgi:hypothetical protein